MSAAPTRGALSTVGAVLSAIASSACCWLPLLLMGFGLSAGGLSAWFERYRLVFLILASVLLALGFYSAYFSARTCDSSCGCEKTTSRTQRFSRVMLWLSAIVVVAFAAFPKYVGAIIARDETAIPVAGDAQSISLTIGGMTCEACSVHLQQSLADVPGVSQARVSYPDERAELTIDPGTPFNPQTALDAVTRAGYSASLPSEPNPDEDAP